ncbi:MAG: M2 family metallopeptidase [Bacteroidales bacterium]|nr:M2 family metallopeptidase [Bacteroidales bacterium]
MKRTINLLLSLIAVVLITSGCGNKNEKMEKELKAFIASWESRVEPLQKAAYEAYWNASISGKDEDYARSEELQFQLNSIYTNKDDFALLKRIKDAGVMNDTLLKRQLDVLYSAYLGNQIDTTLLAKRIKMEVEIEKKYSNFRADVDGKKLSDNEIEELLKTSVNSTELKAAWEGHKKIGPVVANDIIELVKVRNEIAKQLGFKNYHAMSLELSEQNPDDISALFDELDNLTRDAFTGLKDEIDTYLANRLKINKDQLMPWHYQNRFFQEAPAIYSVDLDKYYKEQNIEKLTTDYYTSIGLDISDMLANSDLYEKPGKNQHAYCIDIDNKGDVRILCNIKPNYNWMNTMMHEFGHGVYDKYIDRNLPFSLRNPSHTFTTEAIAMLFGRMGANPQWMQDMGLIDSTEKTKIAIESFRVLRLEQLTFSRWAQVMYRFEKSLYENPDQDLNTLWWDLVEKYQMIKRPADRNEPDWASKIHIATSPCYYHNYLLGELLASQLNHYITANIVKSDDFRNQSFFGNKEAGSYLTDKVFMPGASLYWNDMIEQATGEKLTARYYADQFVN